VAQSDSELLLYSVNNITSGTDAQGEVTVRLSKGGRIVNGQAFSKTFSENNNRNRIWYVFN